jgi:hypothetical protein
VTLLGQPRREMIRRHGEPEPGPLGRDGVIDELPRPNAA